MICRQEAWRDARLVRPLQHSWRVNKLTSECVAWTINLSTPFTRRLINWKTERTHGSCVPTCLLSTIHLIIRTNPKGQNSMVKVQRQLIIKVKVQWSKFKGKVPTSHKACNLSTRLLINCQPNWLSTTWTLRFKLTHFAHQYGCD